MLSIPAARQFINHGHVLINDKKVNISSFICKILDKITFKTNLRIQKLLRINFLNSEQKRQIISERKKSALEIISKAELKDFEVIKFMHSTLLNTKLKTDIPPHIDVDLELLEIYFTSIVLEEDVHLSINENRLIQFYSNRL
jgi:ribosomal protein S4